MKINLATLHQSSKGHTMSDQTSDAARVAPSEVDHAEIHYFNRYLTPSSRLDLAPLIYPPVTTTTVLLRSLEAPLRVALTILPPSNRHSRGNAGSYSYNGDTHTR